MTIKVLSIPHLDRMDSGESGIHTVVRNYFKYAREYDIEFVPPKADSYDLVAAHAGITGDKCDIAHLHGIYFTGDYPSTKWQNVANRNIVNALRSAKIVTVPSHWVQEIFQRDMRFSPHVVPHGVDWDAWQHEEPTHNYVLGYAKNRAGQDVCDPSYLSPLARKFPDMPFLSTFHPDGAPDNVRVTGVIPYEEMKVTTQRAAVFVQAVKETFGLHALEACAAGVPILAYGHGGVLDFVQHGVNGYLAKPGDIDDLARGLSYCLNHRRVLGENGREIARTWTWENAVKRLSEVYHLGLRQDNGDVAVVIPVYNKLETLTRAVQSVLTQTLQPKRIIIIDDGSTDGSGELGKQLADKYPNVEYHHQHNAGVAQARNRGVRMCDTQYVCCLDSDDAIDPRFLETCVSALEKNPSLHLAYTGLRWIKPDGSEGISKWPGEWNFNEQLQRKNQVPTCNVFRRETFNRLGGYRSRYAPKGCGSEDAALWTQFGLHGYACEQVTEEPLFIYSWMSGGTSEPDYHEVDWLALYPSAFDGIHPLASHKDPVNEISHWVFQYDEPVVSVIIPVGPGHTERVADALDSVESQRDFRKWEAIVVNDSGEPIPDWIRTAYPYVRWYETEGKKGPGHARNLGVEHSRANFLIFLDADDMLLPMFMKRVLDRWGQNQAIVYTDYIGSAVISEEEKERHEAIGKLRHWGGEDGISVIGYPSREPAQDFDCEAAQQMPKFPLYHWCLVTCLIPKSWHQEIGGYDEKMESWEDVDYHWRMAWAGKCYTRVSEELVLYRFGSGTRRVSASADTQEGRQIGRKLLRYMDSKKEQIAMTPCKGCGASRSRPVVNQVSSTVQRTLPTQSQQRQVSDQQTNDQDVDLYYYTNPKRGSHRLIGGHLFPHRFSGVRMIKSGNGWRIDYGYHSSDDPNPFLVHNLDVAAQPGHFRKANILKEAPEPEKQELKEPEPVKQSDFAQSTPDNVDPMANFADNAPSGFEPVPPANETAAVSESHDDFDPWLEEDDFDPQTIPGVTAPIARQLQGKTLEDLKGMSAQDWVEIKGVAEVKAEMITQYLANLEE